MISENDSNLLEDNYILKYDAFLKDKFTYNYDRNKELIELLKDNPVLYTAKINTLLSHTLNAHHIWNQRLLDKDLKYGVWDTYLIDELAAINLACYENSLSILDRVEMDELIVYRDTQGNDYKNVANDILFHIINHGTYHRGQLMTLVKAEGVQPLITDFIHFKH